MHDTKRKSTPALHAIGSWTYRASPHLITRPCHACLALMYLSHAYQHTCCHRSPAALPTFQYSATVCLKVLHESSIREPQPKDKGRRYQGGKGRRRTGSRGGGLGAGDWGRRGKKNFPRSSTTNKRYNPETSFIPRVHDHTRGVPPHELQSSREIRKLCISPPNITQHCIGKTFPTKQSKEAPAPLPPPPPPNYTSVLGDLKRRRKERWARYRLAATRRYNSTNKQFPFALHPFPAFAPRTKNSAMSTQTMRNRKDHPATRSSSSHLLSDRIFEIVGNSKGSPPLLTLQQSVRRRFASFSHASIWSFSM